MHEVIFTKGERVARQKYGCVWGNGWVFACTVQSWTMQWIYCCDCIPWKVDINKWSFVKSQSKTIEVNCNSQSPNIPLTWITESVPKIIISTRTSNSYNPNSEKVGMVCKMFIEFSTKTIYIMLYLISFIDFCKYMHIQNLMPATWFKKVVTGACFPLCYITLSFLRHSESVWELRKLSAQVFHYFCQM